ncbi:MAG: hypothetical protein NT051_04345 [Candidatus Micrarchaeota archaeon]|nr:hypothetical protein [Candidatus Micrarchaeota archaeon]
MDDAQKAELIAKAKRLEGKMLYVKAAAVYLELGMGAEAAAAYEKCGDYGKAADLFVKLKREADAARCRKKRDENSTGNTWQDLQADFQKDAGNPY